MMKHLLSNLHDVHDVHDIHEHSSEEMAMVLSQFLVHTLNMQLTQQAQVTLAVSGGQSPLAGYAALQQSDLDWSRVVVTLVDERCVAPDDEASNGRLVCEHLLQGQAKQARWIPWITPEIWQTLRLFSNSNPMQWAEACALAAQIQWAKCPSPLDVVWLGMGLDGHFASIFPQDEGSMKALQMEGVGGGGSGGVSNNRLPYGLSFSFNFAIVGYFAG